MEGEFASAENNNRLSGQQVLLIDDNAVFVEQFKIVLEHEGAEVETAPCGLDGLLAVENGSFDLVILDLLLPDAHGWDIFTQIRDVRPEAILPVVFLSATVDEGEAVSMSKGVRTRTLSKVSSMDELLHGICEVLNV
jgi:DNA-binding response OmpR family regulator